MTTTERERAQAKVKRIGELYKEIRHEADGLMDDLEGMHYEHVAILIDDAMTEIHKAVVRQWAPVAKELARVMV